jgi:hypothetical protein
MNLDWTAIGSIATAAAVVVAIIVAVWESRRHHFAHSVDLIRDLRKDFDSPEFRVVRKKAAESLKGKTYDDPANPINKDSDEVLDFFDVVGYLTYRGALDNRMVWHDFYYWIVGYYENAQVHIAKNVKNDPARWEDFVRIYRTMLDVESDRTSRPEEKLHLSSEKLVEFLEEEIRNPLDT